MFRRIFAVNLVFALLGGITAPSIVASAQVPQSVSVPLIYKNYAGLSFTPISSEMGFSTFGPMLYATNTTPSGTVFVAPLDLPQGAQVYSVDYYVIDASTTSRIDCMMGSYNPEIDGWSTFAGTSTTAEGASDSIQTLTFTYTTNPFETIDNAAKFYYLRVDLDEPLNLKLVGARVGYALPAPPSGSQSITLGGWAFRPDISTMKYAPVGDRIYLTQNAYSFALTSHLNLPSGAHITGLTYYVIDNSPANNVEVNLSAYPANTTDASQVWLREVSTSPLPASTSIQPLVVPVDLTVKAGFNYSLLVKFDAATSALMLVGARLTYTLPANPSPRTTTSFSGFNFSPYFSTHTFSALGGSLYQTNPSNTYDFSVPLDLPQGAHITRVACFAIDNDGIVNHSVTCTLWETRPATSFYDYFHPASSDDYPASTSIRTLEVDTISIKQPEIIDNNLFQYRVMATFKYTADSKVMLVGATVETGYQVFVPAIRR